MARNFRRQRTAQPIADLNVTNLIDLGFMLLIIFMIATPLIQQEQTMAVNLPSVTKLSQPSTTQNDHYVAIAVDAKGFYVDNNPAPLTLPQLRSKVNALATEPKPPIIRMRGDANAPYQKIAELLAELQKAGLKMTLDTKTEP